ncbi:MULTISPECIES: MATE family efflux transporter [Clostridium]|jgi:putative MATE family efflux protein|uniref:Probable multidrug resistance protein NorM n=1 Tax=Clostridium beijerinckii TaxID=1520 RepID=A0AAW3WBF9_CLOBE|nr:MATE family efflux transporter [Clostridium beijerinckii]MBC2458744.1 MATE family efflux transporter [Clostridium beijerinckii]MBC2475823.1 MATE family efflux transporter [Clostridium beijerinckii]MCI1579646.1 MATE family efflux transporter [Clostridium beijerinckii]MCI1586276.1 MATE family efflux transporter [Clostridium beijerinckii]MCI1622857.1 MATE family efflux transporter [Clostridium beijerinckii]
MSVKYVHDMTEGNEVSHIIKFTWPMLIGNVFQQFYNLIDSIVVGKFVGANALAAVGACGSLSFLFFSVCLGLSVGIGIIISQYFGAKKEEQVKRAIANSTYVIGASGVVMSILGVVFARQVLQLLNTPPEILNDSVAFLRIASGGMIAVASYNAIAAILRALGDSSTPLVFLIISCAINVVLDLIFVLKFGLGVSGTAYATVISQACAAIGCLVFALIKNPYFKLKKEHWKISESIITKCIRIGVPVAAQNSLIAVSLVALQSVVNGFGETAVAAFTATSRVEQLIQQPFNSLGAAMSTFAGQNMGANKLDRVKKGYHKSILIVAGFSLLAFIAAQFGGQAIMEVFVKDESVINLGDKAIRITSCAYFPLGMIYVTRGVLNGTGDAFYAMVNGFVEVAGRVGFSSGLAMIPFLGVWSVWVTSGLTWTITAIASVIRYRQGKWQDKSIVKPVEKTIEYKKCAEGK